MRKAPGQADERDFPGDSEERAKGAEASLGALRDPEHDIVDYGDFDGDHSGNDAAQAFEHTDTEAPFFRWAAFFRRKQE